MPVSEVALQAVYIDRFRPHLKVCQNKHAVVLSSAYNGDLLQALILSAAQPSELKAWRLHSHRQRITWSLRTLAAFAGAAATEDRRGVLHSPTQPDCPDLATIIATLLSTKLVLQVERFHAPVLHS